MKGKCIPAPVKISHTYQRALETSLRDVKNEGTSGDVHENTGDDDKMSSE